MTPNELLLTAKKPSNPAWYALGGFVVGIIAAALWNFESKLPPFGTEESEEAVATTSETLPPASGLVSVSAQTAGSSVSVSSVSAVGSWVAVQDLAGTKLGNVLGAVRVTTKGQAMIPLLRATEAGHTYAVVLYRDDGDGEFSVGKDSAYVDYDTGARVVAPFSVK